MCDQGREVDGYIVSHAKLFILHIDISRVMLMWRVGWASLLWQGYPAQRVVEALIHRELESTESPPMQ
jgi:hypothetical protein